MSVLNQLMDQFGSSEIQALSQQLGAEPSQTQSAISAALPMLMGALAKNASNPQGAEALGQALEKDHDGSIIDNLQGFLGSQDNQGGERILPHVFGSQQENVQAGISKMSGMDMSKVGPLLANLAPVVMGMLSKQKSQEGLDVGGLAGMLMNERSVAEQKSAGAMDMLNNFLDQDGDGSAIDDIGGMLGNFLK